MNELLSKASGTWRLVHLFKFFFLNILIFSVSLSAQAVAVSHKNWLIFKVSDQIYFFNDLETIYNDLNSYSCAMPDSIIFNVINLSLKNEEADRFKKASEMIKEKAPFEPTMIEIWKELKTLLKIENYSNTQKVVVADGLDKQVLSLSKGSECNLSAKQLPMINRFLKLEVFLKSRFNPKSVWITDDELKHLKTINPKASTSEIKEKELQRKIKESIEMFIKTLERQIPHEDFW